MGSRFLLLIAACVALGAALAVSASTRAHIADATGGITHDLYTPANAARCVYGPNNC